MPTFYRFLLHLIVLATVLIGFSRSTAAQQSAHSAGGEATGGGGTVSYSVGQVVNNLQSENGFSIYAGVQQPYEISVITGISETTVQLEISAFPNPTADQLKLKMPVDATQSCSFQLFNLHGNLINQGMINSDVELITMNQLVPGIYLLVVQREHEILKTFKITKL